MSQGKAAKKLKKIARFNYSDELLLPVLTTECGLDVLKDHFIPQRQTG